MIYREEVGNINHQQRNTTSSDCFSYYFLWYFMIYDIELSCSCLIVKTQL